MTKLGACFAVLMMLFGTAARAGDDAPAGVFRYVISHSLHGDVGTFTNSIARNGAETVVDSQLRIAAGVLGIVMRRIEEDRREVWRGGRLITYESCSIDNGERVVTRGLAEGGVFVIVGPDGRAEAAPTLFTTNPWSPGITGATQLMGTKTGELNRVTVTGGKIQIVETGTGKVGARHFMVQGDLEREFWYDRKDVLVRIAFPATDGTNSFVLQHRAGPDHAQDRAPAARRKTPEPVTSDR